MGYTSLDVQEPPLLVRSSLKLHIASIDFASGSANPIYDSGDYDEFYVR